jgi:alpha-ribazole phosphatase
VTQFYLVRHAPTHAKVMIGWTDLAADLSDRAALDRLDACLPNAPVASSDLSRAVATADHLTGARPRLPNDPALREIYFGDWEQRSFAQAEAENPALIRAFWETPGAVSAPGGECWDDLTARVWAAADRYLHHDQIILVAHFGAILAMVQRGLAVTATQVFAHKIDNLSVTQVSFDGTAWSVSRINHCP